MGRQRIGTTGARFGAPTSVDRCGHRSSTLNAPLKRTRLRLVALLGATLGPGLVTDAAAEEIEPTTASTDDDHARAVVAVDVEATVNDDREQVEAIVGRTVVEALNSQNIGHDDSAARRLTIEIRFVPESADYEIGLFLVRGSALPAEPLGTLTCAACSAPQLLERITDAVVAEAPRIIADPVPEPATPTPSPTPPEPNTQPQDASADAEGRARPLIVAGGTTAGLGIGALAVGLPLLTRPPRVVSDPAPNVTVRRAETQTSGAIVTAIGLAAVITGSALLAIGLRRRGRTRPLGWIAPAGSRASVGLTWVGRF